MVQMHVFRSIGAAQALRGCSVAIGNFDGVHLGHRRLFEVARHWAARRGAKAVALTFEPHPVRALRPALTPPLLTPLPRKLELFGQCGLGAAVVQPFDLEYARTSAAEFVGRDLARSLGAADVVVGHDFTAGHNRAGVEALRGLLETQGISLHVVEPVTCEGLVVSSTKTRELLLEGNVEGAALLLGRPHDVEGVVTRGDGRGRTLGFATANLHPAAMLPASGVYAIRASLGLRLGQNGAIDSRGARVYDGVCNVGVKPTFQPAGQVGVEAHFFGFEGRDLYDELARVALVVRLREERRFPSLEALRAQISSDAEAARRVLRQVPSM
jgi:riboflavin kinase / FMN adenylyltransferase